MRERFGRGVALLRLWPEWSATAAAAWSLAYAAAAVLWSAGGPGFPFGVADREAGDMGSLFVGLSAGELAPPLAVSCLGAAIVASAMRPGHTSPRRRPLLVVGWGMAVLFALVVPDVRLMRSFA